MEAIKTNSATWPQSINKNNKTRNKSCLETLNKAIEDERPPKGLTSNIKHNISKAPPHLVIQCNSILHETGVKLTKVLVDYWNDQKLAQGLEFE